METTKTLTFELHPLDALTLQQLGTAVWGYTFFEYGMKLFEKKEN